MVFAFGWTPGIPEVIVILVVALLLFGKRLPEVARSMGKGIVEFKRGLRHVEDDIERESNAPPTLPQSMPEIATPSPAPPAATPTDAVPLGEAKPADEEKPAD